MTDDIVRILKVIEYRGPRRAVEAAIKRSWINSPGAITRTASEFVDRVTGEPARSGRSSQEYVGEYTITGNLVGTAEILARDVAVPGPTVIALSGEEEYGS